MHRHFLTSALLLAASTASAQSPISTGPDSLPRELVEGLLRAGVSSYPGDGTEFVVGRVPARLAPFMYVPQNARVLGGLENSNTTVTIMTMRMSREELRATFARELPRLGWTPATGRSGYAGWGFMPAPGTAQSGMGLEFCHIGQSLQINPAETPSGLSVVAVVRNYGSACGGRTPVFVSTSPGFNGVDAPTLVNPVDTGMNLPDCYQPVTLAASPGRIMNERLKTSIPADKLLEHYARQLADSGWTTAGSQGSTARRTWTRPDSGGTVHEVTLTVTPSAVPTCQEVSMQVRQIRKP